MMGIIRNEWPIILGVGFSVLAAVTGWLVWYDNLPGFRDASAFSSLLAAIFSMLSTIWLVVAVLRQGQELKLQREELRLQRFETMRLADEATAQSGLQRLTSNLQTRNGLRDTVQRLVDINDGHIYNMARTLQRIACDSVAPDRTEMVLDGTGGSVVFGSEGAIVDLINNGPGGSDVRFVEWDNLISDWKPNNDGWLALTAVATDAHEAGVSDWWKKVLVYSIAPKFPDRTNLVQAILTVAIIKARDC